ncbi:hypothetical protein ACSQ67_001870 [Phaseolus vulgaris]
MSLASSTLSCAFPVKQTSGDTFISTMLQWIRYIFLTPCPQRAILSFVDVVLLVFLFVFAATKLWKRSTFNGGSTTDLSKPLIGNVISVFHTTMRFKLTITGVVLLTVLYTVASVLTFSSPTMAPWKQVDEVFWLVQAITHAVLVVFIIHEKRFQVVAHPLSVRVYWIVNFFVILLFIVSAVVRLVSVDVDEVEGVRVDEVVSFISFPLSLFLLFVAVEGSTGIVLTTEETRPLVEGKAKLHDGTEGKSEVTGFASASLLSKTFWIWMNPLLSKGYKSVLKIDDVPTLSPEHRAERMSSIFESKWPTSNETSKHPVGMTLLRCFWKELAFSAFLAIIRLCVMFVGPVLIQSFVDFTSGKGNSKYEGYYLVLILLVAKFIEVMSTHHFNFQAQKLGMLIRCTLISSLYKKGLKLSFSSRKEHGVGTIVNYMAVDTQQLSDMMLQLHAVWMMPLQVGIGLVLLYKCLGDSVVTAFLGLVCAFAYSVKGNKRNNKFLQNLMVNRDSRMKAVNEMLNYMSVIKFQAWEEHFKQRILGFRETEYGWLSKLMFSICSNIVVLWSTPLLISAITFGTAILLGVKLDAATVFTTTTVFRLLQEPIRTFPQCMISLSQAMISLERLDRFMLSGELSNDSVEREEGCGEQTAVEIIDGTFSWDDDSTQQDLKNINLKIKKGELTAIVGTVGSGKSSLLISILGEMHKISGKVTRDGTIVQSGKYEDLLESGMDFKALVDAHETSMELVEQSMITPGENLNKPTKALEIASIDKGNNGENNCIDEPKSSKKSSKLVQEEERETGKVSLRMYKLYCTEAFGWWGITIVLVLSVLWQVSLMASDYWLAYETSEERAKMFNPSLFIYVYAIIAVVSSVLLVGRSYFVTLMGIRTAQLLFTQIVRSILHAPMSFFDTTPSGRILSRVRTECQASTDQTNVDVLLPLFMGVVITMYITVLSIFIITCQNSWPTVFLIIPLVWLNLWYRDYYLASSREFTRMDSITKAPVIQYFSETIAGVMTIRSFRKQKIFCVENLKRVNSNLRIDFHNYSSNEWLGFRIELFGSIVFCISALFMIILPNGIIKPENIGLSLSYGLSLNAVLFWAVYISCFIENKMVSVERIKQFTNIPSEPAWNIKDHLPPSNWPGQGNVDIKDLQSLERCQLKDVVAAKPEKLDSLVVENGENWSVGQRQLVCLGRVILKRSRLLFMDEATASVDSQTDGVIQKIIREEFAACTIISIAHRIPTVMDCDRVLVVDAGRAKEYDKPSNLLQRESLFGALVQEYANRSSGL